MKMIKNETNKTLVTSEIKMLKIRVNKIFIHGIRCECCDSQGSQNGFFRPEKSGNHINLELHIVKKIQSYCCKENQYEYIIEVSPVPVSLIIVREAMTKKEK